MRYRPCLVVLLLSGLLLPFMGCEAPASLTAIQITPSTQSIAAGSTTQFTATGTYSHGSHPAVTEDITNQVTWASNTPSVATIAASGLATGVSGGTASITASAPGFSGQVSGSATLTVTAPPVLSAKDVVTIAVTPTAPTVSSLNETTQFIAIGTTAGGASVNITGSSAWSSSDIKVASVSASGLATGLSAGSSTITALFTNADGTVASGAATFKVAPAAVQEPLIALSIVPATQTALAVNQTAQFIAIGTTSSGTSVNLTSTAAWSSSNSAIATVAAGGLATAHASGTAAITAIASNPDGTVVSGSAALTVNIPANTEPLVSMTIVPGTQTAQSVNETIQYIAIGTTGTGATVNLTGTATWASSDLNVASIGASSGLAKALASGTTAITAIATNPDGTVVSGTASLTVSISATKEPLVSLSVVPAAQTVLAANQSAQFIAIGTTSAGTTVNLTSQATWSSSSPAVASVISTTGVATAQSSGTAAITAIATNPDGTVVSGSAALTVSISATAEPLVSVSIVPAAETVVAGQTAQFLAIGTTSTGASVNLTNPTTLAGKSYTPVWSSSNTAVATITSGGLATAGTAGATAITVVVANPDGTAVSGSAALTVTAASEPLVSLAILPAAQTVTALTQTVSYVAIGTTASGATVDLTNQTATLSGVVYSAALWSSSVGTVASIDPNTGKATPLLNGSTAIVARVTNKSDGTVVTASVPLTVNLAAIQEPLLSMAIVPGSQSVASVGQSSQFLAIGDFSPTATTPGYQNMSGVTTYKVAWSSSNPQVASIDTTGKVTAVGVGTTAITAVATNNTDGSGVIATAAFTVLGAAPEPIAAMTIFPGSQAVTLPPVGSAPQTAQFIAIGTNGSTGLQLDVSSQVVWTSTNPLVATVSATGLATALTQGSTTINAVAHNADKSVVTATATLTVNAAAAEPLLSIAILPGTQTLEAKQSSNLIAIGSYSTNPASLNITGAVTWATSNAAVASITPAGVVTGDKAGTAVVTAIGTNPDGSVVTGTATITVTAATEPLLSMSILPGADSVAAVGQTSQLLAIGDFLSTAATPGFQNLATVGGYTLTWYSSNTQVATVDSNGNVTAVGIGTAAITATAISIADNSGASASASFTVSGPPAEQISTLTIFPGSQTVSLAQPGAALNTIGYIALGTNGTTGVQTNVSSLVSWASTNPLVAQISSSGVATLLTAGTTTITATVTNTKDSSVVTATATLTVTASVEPLLSLAIIPGNQSIGTPGVVAHYYAIGTTSSGATVDLTNKTAVINGVSYSAALWTSSIPAVGTIDPATGIAAPAGIGTTAIVARVTNTSDGSTVAAAATFTSNIPLEPIVSVAVLPGTQTIGTLGQQITYRAIGTTAAGATVDLTTNGFSTASGQVSAAAWTSSASAVASMNLDPTTKIATNVATANVNGITAIVATVTNPDKSVVTGSSLLTVNASPTPEPFTSITIVPATLTAQAGQTAQFIALGTTASGSTVNLTNPVTYGGTLYTPVWNSSTASVATMSATANGVAMANGAGATAITVEVPNPADGSVVSGSAVLTVTAASEPLVSLAVYPAAQTATSQGQQVQFIAIGTTASGATVNLTGQSAKINGTTIAAATWSSSSSSVASMNLDPVTLLPTNVASAQSNGVTVITAQAINPGDGTVVTGSTTLTVAIPANKEPLVSIAVYPATQTLLAAGQQANFIAIGTLASGATVNLTNQTYPAGSSTPTISAATWSSSSTAIAKIDQNTGIATALNSGAVAITAVAYNTADGTAVSGSAVLTVTAAAEPLVSLTVSPVSQTATSLNQPVAFIAIGTTASGATVNMTNQSYTPSGTTKAIQPAQWSSSSITVANCVNPVTQVSNSMSGVFWAYANGATVITAVVTNPDGSVVTGSTAFTVAISATAEPLMSMAIVPGSQSVASVGQNSQLYAIGDFSASSTTPGYQNITNGTAAYPVVWRSSNTQVATVGSSDVAGSTPGLVTSVGVGTTTITALATYSGTGGDNSGVLATAGFSVTGPAPVPISALSIFPGTQSLVLPLTASGISSQALKFYAIGTNGSTGVQMDVSSGYGVQWTSTNPLVANIGSNGMATVLGPGSTTITAVLTNTGSIVTATATLTVTTGSEPLLSIAVLPGTQSLAAGQQSQLIAFGTYSSAPVMRSMVGNVAWSSSNTAIASVNSSTGMVKGVAPGTAVITITASNPDGSIVIGSATVTVTTATEPLLSMSIFPAAATLASVGQTSQLSAIGDFSPTSTSTLSGFLNMVSIPSDPTMLAVEKPIVWTSSNPLVATVDNTTTNTAGTVTAVGIGTAAITAVATNQTDNSVVTASGTVTVTGPATTTVSALSIFPNSQTVTLAPVGSTTQASFMAVGTYGATGQQENVTGISGISWTSSNPQVAAISTVGATAATITALTAGSTTIRAVMTNADNTVVTASATLTVLNQTELLQSIAVLPGTQSVASPGQKGSLVAIGSFSSAPYTLNMTSSPVIVGGVTFQPAVWSSSNNLIATVSAGVVTCVNQGTVAIMATATNPDGTLVENSASFTCINSVFQQISALTIVPGAQSLSALGQSAQFMALGTDPSTGLQTDVTSQVTWNVTVPSIASIGNGLAACQVQPTPAVTPAATCPGQAWSSAPGTTNITATYTNPAVGSTPASVVSAAPATLTVTQTSTPEPLLSITIIPGTITVNQIYDTGQFLAFGNWSTTPTVTDITNQVTWISTEPDYFPISTSGAANSLLPPYLSNADAGVVTAYAAGSAVILAEYQNPDKTIVTGTATFTCPAVPGVAGCGTAYPAQMATLTVYNAGEGNDWEVSDAEGLIHCGPGYGANSVCTATYPLNATVTLTETPGTNPATSNPEVFGGWSANCTINLPNSCQVSLTNNASVGAIFNLQ
jgi:uncharacterized protein YjdB/uncharacterized protein YcfL